MKMTNELRTAVKSRSVSHAKAAHNASEKQKKFARENNVKCVALINKTALANKCDRDEFDTHVASKCSCINSVILADKKATHTVESVYAALNECISKVLIRRHFDSLVVKHCVCDFVDNKSSVKYFAAKFDAKAIARREKLASK